MLYANYFLLAKIEHFSWQRNLWAKSFKITTKYKSSVFYCFDYKYDHCLNFCIAVYYLSIKCFLRQLILKLHADTCLLSSFFSVLYASFYIFQEFGYKGNLLRKWNRCIFFTFSSLDPQTIVYTIDYCFKDIGFSLYFSFLFKEK